MNILGIDTSCDDTCAAVLEAKNKKLEIRSNIISSQVKVHQRYGGVYPSLAKREHQKNLPLVLKKALAKAKTKPRDIDAIAVTVGPGLEPCLWVGVNFAKDLARQWKLPIIPVNHIESHIVANLLPQVSENPKSKIQNPNQITNSNTQNAKPIGLPAICLVVSGGHTQLILMKKIGDYKTIGETRDDAAGECFDKTARLLGLAYPGGPAIAAAAAKNAVKSSCSGQTAVNYTTQIKLPRPMMKSKDYDFSFSGLKTAVLYFGGGNTPQLAAGMKAAKRTCPTFVGRSRLRSAKAEGIPAPWGEVVHNHKKRAKKTRESKEYVRAMAKEIQQAIIDVLIKKTIKAAKGFRVKTVILGGGVAANEELRKQFKNQLSLINNQINFLVPPKNLCTDNAAMVAAAGCFNQGKKESWQQTRAIANLRI